MLKRPLKAQKSMASSPSRSNHEEGDQKIGGLFFVFVFFKSIVVNFIWSFFFYKFIYFIYLFSSVGSSFLCEGFL